MKLRHNNYSSVAMVGAAVAVLVSIMISVIIVFSVAGGIDVTGLNADVRANFPHVAGYPMDAYNNSTAVTDSMAATVEQSEVFYTIAPIVVVVMAAVIILAYITRIGM